jgi:hypothetical protein
VLEQGHGEVEWDLEIPEPLFGGEEAGLDRVVFTPQRGKAGGEPRGVSP